LACGAGVQAIARRFGKTPVLPGVNTTFIGVLETQGIFTEECSGCGNCRLDIFGGICPVTRCAKKLLNGPCGDHKTANAKSILIRIVPGSSSLTGSRHWDKWII
jgi:hypothetical protein